MSDASDEAAEAARRAVLAQTACMLEACARKLGNVHRLADFDDLHFVDFLTSAAAIGPALAQVGRLGVGRCVLECIRATRLVCTSNTNLGIALLLAPLARMSEAELEDESSRQVFLDQLTLDDARAVYHAIRETRPAGLGAVESQDVASDPSLPLAEVMRLAADRDLIARQYAYAFVDVVAAEDEIVTGVEDGLSLEAAIVSTHLSLMATHPDSLIVRKRGPEVGAEAQRLAIEARQVGGIGTVEGRQACQKLDRWLRADGHARNPGSTADLLAAALFVGLRRNRIALPARFEPIGWLSDSPRNPFEPE